MREDKDLTQIEVANAIGISQRNYSYLETGRSSLTSEILIKLAKFYNVSIDYILYLTDVRSPYPDSIMNENKEKVGF